LLEVLSETRVRHTAGRRVRVSAASNCQASSATAHHGAGTRRLENLVAVAGCSVADGHAKDPRRLLRWCGENIEVAKYRH